MPCESPSYEDWEVPRNWTNKDIGEWILARLESSSIDSVEVYRDEGKIVFRVHDVVD